MAKALSQVYTAIRGSVGGVTYTANSYHSIIARARVAPANPRTNNQEQWREAFRAAVGDWVGLSSGERTAWNDYALSLTGSGGTGSYAIPGRQAFIGARSVLRRAMIGGQVVTPIDTAPPAGSGYYNDVFILNLAASPGELSFDVNNFGGEDLLLYSRLSPALDATRNYWSGPWPRRSFDTCDSGNVTTVTLTGLTGGRYFLRVSGVTLTGGNRMYTGRTVMHPFVGPPSPPAP